MKTFLSLFLLIIFFGIYSSTSAAEDQCFVCHESIGGAEVELYKKDIHFKKGISCGGCHGGNSKSEDMDIAMSKSSGFKGAMKGDDISLACAKCHADNETMKKYASKLPTDQFELLQKSVHGKLSTTGKERIVQCITCHKAHGIVSVNNPASPVYPLNVPKTCSQCHSNAVYMRSYNPSLPIDQYEKYITSFHGILNRKGDSNTAECASCHGSHEILSVKDVNSKVYPINLPSTCSHCHSDAEYMKAYKIPTDQFEKFSASVHGIALLQKHDVGAPACNSCHGNHAATPPGVESISKVCGTCHALNAELFSSSPHKKAFDQQNLPECETCHGNHEIIIASDKLLGVTPEAVCSKCHTSEKNQKGFNSAKFMRILIDSLTSQEIHAKNLVDQAEQKGMEIAEAKFKLRDIHQAKLEARTMVHSFNEAKYKEVVGKGFSVTSFVSTEAQAAIDEFYFRRYGLLVSVLLISLLALALFLFIKRIEAKK
jgi:predicted CXXCH cytochrome family protein